MRGRPALKWPQQSPTRTEDGPLPGLIWRYTSDPPNRRSRSPFISINTGDTEVDERPRGSDTRVVVDRARLRLW